MGENAATAPLATCLSQTRAGLAAIDASKLGVEPARYRALAQTLESLPAQVYLPKLFQVDLVKSPVISACSSGAPPVHRARASSDDFVTPTKRCGNKVERHPRAEEALQPDAVFAEVVHLPEGRLGNILLRPVLRDYEIPYLGALRRRG